MVTCLELELEAHCPVKTSCFKAHHKIWPLWINYWVAIVRWNLTTRPLSRKLLDLNRRLKLRKASPTFCKKLRCKIFLNLKCWTTNSFFRTKVWLWLVETRMWSNIMTRWRTHHKLNWCRTVAAKSICCKPIWQEWPTQRLSALKKIRVVTKHFRSI